MEDVDRERLKTYRGNHQSVVMGSQESGRGKECRIPVHITMWRSRFADPHVDPATPVILTNVQALQSTDTCERADRSIFKRTFQSTLVEIRSMPEQVATGDLPSMQLESILKTNARLFYCR